MSEFKNVTVIKTANIYFDGKVSSRTIVFANGTTTTLGIMQPGEYEFGTEKKELMEILSGQVSVLLPDSEDWQKIEPGESFEVPGNAKFRIKIGKVTDYCCSYLD
ncbi:MAG: pyrimidine/purine nucleoside phosphorylase [Candidatus Electrothrix sp. AR4]|nr:pyrimidine/purine nucleoside phosphorylase [Candidatus Electrothrix sp. AR4]